MGFALSGGAGQAKACRECARGKKAVDHHRCNRCGMIWLLCYWQPITDRKCYSPSCGGTYVPHPVTPEGKKAKPYKEGKRSPAPPPAEATPWRGKLVAPTKPRKADRRTGLKARVGTR